MTRIAIVAGLVCLAVALAGAATGDSRAPAPAKRADAREAGTPPERVPLRRLVGAKVVGAVDGTRASRSLLRRVRRGELGGVVLFARNVGSRSRLRRLTRSLRRAARAGGAPGFVVSIDQEGGPVKRLAGPPHRSPVEIGASGSRRLASREGAATGRYLRGLGIGVDLAPVLDVGRRGSFMASRSFGATPARVARLGVAFALGLQRAGVAAAAKHFPGLGRSDQNTDFGVSVVRAPRRALEADLPPFRAAIARDVRIVMMSTAVYTAYGSRPAALSRRIVTGLLRRRLGFEGVIVTDTLGGAAVRAVTTPGRAAVASVRAGADMVLVGGSERSSAAMYRALLRAARSGRLDRAALGRSYARISALQRDFGR